MPQRRGAVPDEPRSASQTLSRGLTALEILAESDAPLTIAELSERLGLHRSITYRIVRTLEDHRLVVRDGGGGLRLGSRLASLARSVSRELQSAALPELTALASDLAMTAFVAVLDGAEVSTLVSVEPRHTHAAVAQQPGTRHSILIGAPGRAIRSILTVAERTAVAVLLGEPVAAEPTPEPYATSHDEVIHGLSSVAVPLRVGGYPPAAVAVVYLQHEIDVERVADALTAAASNIVAVLN
jgi:DNA-binding IclR family transcriptional regulator